MAWGAFHGLLLAWFHVRRTRVAGVSASGAPVRRRHLHSGAFRLGAFPRAPAGLDLFGMAGDDRVVRMESGASGRARCLFSHRGHGVDAGRALRVPGAGRGPPAGWNPWPGGRPRCSRCSLTPDSTIHLFRLLTWNKTPQSARGEKQPPGRPGAGGGRRGAARLPGAVRVAGGAAPGGTPTGGTGRAAGP